MGKFLTGSLDNSKPSLAPELNWYKTTEPTNKWVASDTASIAIVIFNKFRSSRQKGTSLTINPIEN